MPASLAISGFLSHASTLVIAARLIMRSGEVAAITSFRCSLSCILRPMPLSPLGITRPVRITSNLSDHTSFKAKPSWPNAPVINILMLNES